MLHTLYQFGKQLSTGRHPWDDFLDYRLPKATKEGNRQLVLPIIFRPGQQTITMGEVEAYDPKISPGKDGFRYLRVKGGSGFATYLTIGANKLALLGKSLFGKKLANGTFEAPGDFIKAALKQWPEVAQTQLYKALTAIMPLAKVYDELVINPETTKPDLKQLLEKASITGNDQVVLLVAAIHWPEGGIEQPTPFVHLQGFEQWFEKTFISQAAGKEGLDYVTGQQAESILPADFGVRYNINKMFVTTTQHYAHDFEKEHYTKNYQLDTNTLKFLERGSEYLLEQYRVRIADIEHVIIPQARSQANVQYTKLGQELKANSDLLFQLSTHKALAEKLDRKVKGDLYWLTYLAIESDGNFFKTMNLIQEVSQPYLHYVTEKLDELNNEMYATPGTAWQQVCGQYTFNLNSVYPLIPVRKDKEKVNKALVFFKDILEQRKVNVNMLYEYFVELLLCHRYVRYTAYKNVTRPFKDKLDLGIRDAVMKYIALFKLLRSLNLIINMENTDVEPTQEGNDYYARIQEFMQRMGYKKPAHIALFYLGRALNRVAFKQSDSSHDKKPVLNKVDFNGMDWFKIMRLQTDLREKTQQYSLHNAMEPLLQRFYQYMPISAEQFDVSPQESLFFLFAGYSYFEPGKKKNVDEQETEN